MLEPEVTTIHLYKPVVEVTECVVVDIRWEVRYCVTVVLVLTYTIIH